jgi:predicted acetyltransferase
VEIRPIDPEELRAFVEVTARAFGLPAPHEPSLTADLATLEADRCVAAVDDGAIVGTTATYSLRTRVPGGAVVPTAGITAVGVLPTHRRRGILTELLTWALDQAVERGEPLSSLLASEAAIYGRYGYGVASWNWMFDVDATRSAFHSYEQRGRARLLSAGDALEPFTDVYTRATADRPGAEAVTADDMRWVVRDDDPATPKRFYVLHEDADGRPDAAAIYRMKHRWQRGLPNGELTARQAWATTPQAAADLWRYLLDVDLVTRVRTAGRPPDDPLRWLLREPRALRARLAESLLARPIDVAASLSARTFAADGRVVIEVNDVVRPATAATVALEVAGGVGVAAPTTDEPDLVCEVRAIGPVLFGGATWREQRWAGVVEERREGAVARADTMFATPVPPWTPLDF